MARMGSGNFLIRAIGVIRGFFSSIGGADVA
jgi:hypothetical protein